jgi:hypothetical protein
LSWHLIMGLVRSWAGGRGARRRESRCRVPLITSSFYGISKEGAP